MALTLNSEPDLAALRGELAARRINRRYVATLLGYSDSLFSLIINGKRPTPTDFEEEVHAAMNRLEAPDQVTPGGTRARGGRRGRGGKTRLADKRILRRHEVADTVRLSQATIYRMIGRGEFPAPVQLGPRAVGWREADVVEWLESREQSTGGHGGGI